jgi:hypothetical protein
MLSTLVQQDVRNNCSCEDSALCMLSTLAQQDVRNNCSCEDSNQDIHTLFICEEVPQGESLL